MGISGITVLLNNKYEEINLTLSTIEKKIIIYTIKTSQTMMTENFLYQLKCICFFFKAEVGTVLLGHKKDVMTFFPNNFLSRYKTYHPVKSSFLIYGSRKKLPGK